MNAACDYPNATFAPRVVPRGFQKMSVAFKRGARKIFSRALTILLSCSFLSMECHLARSNRRYISSAMRKLHHLDS
jgi:hypothetical protein